MGADYDIAFNYLMDDEDRARSGAVVTDPTTSDASAVARFGINSHWFPEAKTDGFYEMPTEEAFAYVKSFYKYRFFAAILGYQIACQDIANKYLDLAVNEGVSEATKIMQRACNQVSSPVTIGKLTVAVDGIPGQMTVAAINKSAPEVLLPTIRAYAADFYRSVANRLKWSTRQTAAMLTRANR
jgi:lysozyme family protein